jgi:hypothetical protein
MATNAQHQAAWRRRQKEKIEGLQKEVADLRDADADELFCMTNLYPRHTGLPMVIWVGPRYGVPHDVRIKVSMTHGQRMNPGNLAVVALRPQPHVVERELSSADLQLISRWIALNEAAILDHWNELIDGVGLVQRLQPLPPPS